MRRSPEERYSPRQPLMCRFQYPRSSAFSPGDDASSQFLEVLARRLGMICWSRDALARDLGDPHRFRRGGATSLGRKVRVLCSSSVRRLDNRTCLPDQIGQNTTIPRLLSLISGGFRRSSRGVEPPSTTGGWPSPSAAPGDIDMTAPARHALGALVPGLAMASSVRSTRLKSTRDD